MSEPKPRQQWRWHIPEFFNIGEACTHCGRDPQCKHRIALTVDCGDDYNDSFVRKINYQQLEKSARCFAGAVTGLGLTRQQRLMIRLPNSLEYPIAFMGTLLAGGIAVPASTQLTAEEVAYLARDAGVSVLLITSEDLLALQGVIASLPDLRHVVVLEKPGAAAVLENPGAAAVLDKSGAAAIDGGDNSEAGPYSLKNPFKKLFTKPFKNQLGETVAVHPWKELLQNAEYLQDYCRTRADDPAYLVYTSGTTGYPKGVLHAHRALLGRQPSSDYWFDFSGDDRILHSGKLNWTYALGTAMMDPFYRGQSVVLYEGPPKPGVWPELIAKHQCTIFIGVPTVYRQILQRTDFVARNLPSLRYCMSAGEHLSDEILSRWQQRFGQTIYEAVGMSEFSYYLSHHASMPLRPGSAGLPQPGHDLALLDRHMKPVADDTEGMLCIPLNDPGLFIKYWGLEQETAACRRDGYFLTGDYARRDSDGYYWFLGRKDEIINCSGYRISPIEIERVLKAMPGVADCVVIDERIDRDKNIVTACIIQDQATPLEADAVITYAAEHLAAYKVPRKVRFMESFPRTSNGKVLRREVKVGFSSRNGGKADA